MNKGKWRKWEWKVLSVLGILALVYFLGPRPAKPDFSLLHFNPCTTDLQALEDSIRQAEASLSLKKDNEARIIWMQPFQKTKYSIVYLPGNGASQEEGDPIHEALAHRYGCNLFLARPVGHGLVDENVMLKIDPVDWMQSALDAIAVGQSIGEQVILVSCSTGSTLGLYLQSRFPDIAIAHLMMSPNIDLHDPRSSLLVQPWGLQIARVIMGGKFYTWSAPESAQAYWYTRYRIEGLIALKSMIDASMQEENFKRINTPVLMTYYFRDEANQDTVVSVPRMKEMFRQVGTAPELKREVALPDAGTHMIGCDIFNAHLESLWRPMTAYCEEVLKLSPVDTTGWKQFLDPR